MMEETTTDGQPESGRAPHRRYEIKKYQKISKKNSQEKNPDKKLEKKTGAIKEISRLLNDIESSKKTKKLIYFSDLQKRSILSPDKRKIGLLKDLAVSGGEKFPEVSHLLIHAKGEDVLIPWKNVEEFGKAIILDRAYSKIDRRAAKEDDIFLGEHILDKQVVDVNGLKVIRVNDIALTYIKNRLAVVNIDVGARSMLRRLGFEKLIRFLPIEVKDRPVPWDTIEPLTNSLEKIHLKVPCPRVADLHPADVAELFEELSLKERATLLKSMKSETAAKVILECEQEVKHSLMNGLKTRRLAAILEKMPPNDAANLLTECNNHQVTLIFKHMKKDPASKVQEMLSFKEGTVARYMTERFVTVKADMTVSQTRDHLKSISKLPDNFHYMYILDANDNLCGVISLKTLILAEPEKTMQDLLVPKVISLDINDPMEYAEELITKYDLAAIPVVDVNGKIRGILNIDDILDVVIERHQAKEPFELSDNAKEDILAKKRRKRYSTIIKDVGQLMRDLDIRNIRRKRKQKGGKKEK